MADIRINSLPSTASASSSDDFLALDGATNGTRKLSAYSPTFGGNLTVSGTIGTGKITVSSANLRLSNSYYLAGNLVAGTEIPLIGRNIFDKVAIDPDGYGTSIGGNLTVSGTGTSTFGGKIQTTSANGIEAIVASGNTGLSLQSSTTQYSLYLNKADDSYRVYSSIGNTDRLMLTSGGNLLIGTTTDGGQKLQVSGTAAFAGAINLTASGGTASINTTGATGVVQISTASGNNVVGLAIKTNKASSLYGAYIDLDTTSATNGRRWVISSNGDLDSAGVGSLQFLDITGNVTALKIDSSANATFAGQIVAGGVNKTHSFTGGDGGAGTTILAIKDAAGTLKANFTGDGKLILSGILRLGNTYVAGAPTATGYVTIQDSAGNTYKVLVGT